MNDPEIKAMMAINEALLAVEEQDARLRVLKWTNDKFGFMSTSDKPATPKAKVMASQPTAAASSSKENELPGIGMISENGEFNFTVRDLKARSGNDAALRLVHIAIRAYQQLTGQKGVSSKSVLVPLLKGWRLYDGNTRREIARHKGIIRNGDELSLDYHAQTDADRYIAEVLDESIQGAWRPGSKAKRKVTASDKAG